MGTFIPEWVAHLEDGIILNQFELRAIKRFMRVIASGARLVMREYARLKEVSEGDTRELRQLSIVQFTETEPVTFKAPKPIVGSQRWEMHRPTMYGDRRPDPKVTDLDGPSAYTLPLSWTD